ncbi:putative NADH-cytochrome b5 reductase 1 [Cladochytrium replicatum]|nr:putative NADH-cytochrome b5 reductase 1 [Cladochytrium replicatum]
MPNQLDEMFPIEGPVAQFLALTVVIGLFGMSILIFRAGQASRPAISKIHWAPYPLTEKKQLTPNTFLFRFSLPKNISLNVPIGQHISIGTEINGKMVSRSYTPVSTNADKGYFDMVIKVYENGLISKHVGSLNIGDKANFMGPKGNFIYVPNMVKEIGMIAGGSGITPMLQIIKAILANPNDKTTIKLMFANVTEQDIILRDEIDALVAKSEGRVDVLYVLDKPPAGWTGGSGFVSKEMISNFCPKPASNIKILLCGPLPMIKHVTNLCAELGYDKANAISKPGDMVYKF